MRRASPQVARGCARSAESHCTGRGAGREVARFREGWRKVSDNALASNLSSVTLIIGELIVSKEESLVRLFMYCVLVIQSVISR